MFFVYSIWKPAIKHAGKNTIKLRVSAVDSDGTRLPVTI